MGIGMGGLDGMGGVWKMDEKGGEMEDVGEVQKGELGESDGMDDLGSGHDM